MYVHFSFEQRKYYLSWSQNGGLNHLLTPSVWSWVIRAQNGWAKMTKMGRFLREKKDFLKTSKYNFLPFSSNFLTFSIMQECKQDDFGRFLKKFIFWPKMRNLHHIDRKIHRKSQKVKKSQKSLQKCKNPRKNLKHLTFFGSDLPSFQRAIEFGDDIFNKAK